MPPQLQQHIDRNMKVEFASEKSPFEVFQGEATSGLHHQNHESRRRQDSFETQSLRSQEVETRASDESARTQDSHGNPPHAKEATFSRRRLKAVAKKYARFIGPGIMISVAYMDPGNYATGVTAGASNRFSLLFITLLSSVMAVFLQSLCIKLGTVTGYDLARCCREHLPRKLNYVLWFLAECAIIATDVAEVIGTAVALNILLHIPLPAGVAITIVDVLVVLAAYRSDTPLAHFVRYFEYAVATFVLGVVVCFAVEMAYLPSSVSAGSVLRGYVPSKQMFEGSGLTIATSIIGATVMIHSLFLGSGLVQPRLREYDYTHGHMDLPEETGEKEKQDAVLEYIYSEYKPSYYAMQYCLKYSVIELVVTLLTAALFVNSAILVLAGATLYGTPDAVDADLYSIHHLLLTTLAPAVGTIFMLALLFSGQSAGIVCTIAGQMISEGHLKWTVRPWIRRLATRGIAIVPCLIISICIGKDALNSALNVSQVVISILLPPLTAPLIYFTCSKKIMRVQKPSELWAGEEPEYWQMQNSWLTTAIAVVVWLFISVLNVYAIVQMAQLGIQG